MNKWQSYFKARIGFIGQEQDIEPRHSSGSPLRSDMVWLNDTARYYDPEIGRFLSVDPLFEQFAEQTPYNYCFNSPLINSDASGLSPDKEKKRDQMHATEIDLFAFNQSSVMLNQSRYESSRNPSYLDMMLANLERKQYLLSILGGEYYNNFFGSGGGSGGERTGQSGNSNNSGVPFSVNYKGKKYNDPEEMANDIYHSGDDLNFQGKTIEEIQEKIEEIYYMDQVEVSDYRITFFDRFIAANKLTLERMKEYLPDAYTLSVGFTGIAATGAGTSIDLNYILKGKDASIIPTITITESIGIGYDVNAYISGNITYYYGKGDFLSGMFETSIGNREFSYFGSFSADYAVDIGYNVNWNRYGMTNTHGLSIGVAPPVFLFQ